MRIGFDIDGVIYPWHDAVYGWCVNNKVISNEDYVSFWSKIWYTKSEIFKSNMQNDASLYETHIPPKKLMEFLNNVASKHEIYYVTSRPMGLERVTQSYLERYKFPYATNLIFSNEKALEVITNRLELFVEDSFTNAKAVAKHCRSYLINAPYNISNGEFPGVVRINSLYELKEVLN